MTQGYRYVGFHPDELESGQPLEPGQFISDGIVNPDAAKDKHLIDDGLLIEAKIPNELPDEHPPTLTSQQTEGVAPADTPSSRQSSPGQTATPKEGES